MKIFVWEHLDTGEIKEIRASSEDVAVRKLAKETGRKDIFVGQDWEQIEIKEVQ